VIKRIIVAGKPASGKSTLIELLSNSLRKINVPVLVIDDYQVLKEMCPQDLVSEKYYYDSGSLILRDQYRDDVMEKQGYILRQKWESEFKGVIIMEIANPSLLKFLKKFIFIQKESVLLNSGIIFLSCELKLAKKRNSLRLKYRRIPEIFVNMFVKNDYQVFKSVKDFFEYSFFVSNNLDTKNLKMQTKKILETIRG
jgi:tRNA uridine 5-carbamoylmethylation protein Kti12